MHGMEGVVYSIIGMVQFLVMQLNDFVLGREST